MAQVIDVRGSGGNLIIAGGALTLPTSDNAVATPLAGSVRYNITSTTMEIYIGSSWTGLTSGSGGTAGVTSFNTRIGNVTLTSADVVNALGYTPPSVVVSSFNTRTGSVSLTSTDVTTALGFTPLSVAVLSFNTRTGAVTLSSSDVTTALGFTPMASGVVPYASLPSSLQTIPIVLSQSGLPPGATQMLTLPVTVLFSLPANCTGSVGYASATATASSVFTLAYWRSGVQTTIGTITFAIGAHSATFATSAYTAAAGDVITVTSPTSQDATLANVGIVILGTRAN